MVSIVASSTCEHERHQQVSRLQETSIGDVHDSTLVRELDGVACQRVDVRDLQVLVLPRSSSMISSSSFDDYHVQQQQPRINRSTIQRQERE